MTLFRRDLPERRAVDATVDALIRARGLRTSSGEVVTDETAMRHAAVWGCVDLIAELVSTLPVDEFRRLAGGVSEATASSFIADPAGDGTGSEVWLRQVVTSLLLRGNAFGFVTSLGQDGWPRTVEVLHPDRVTLTRELNWGPVAWQLDSKPIDRWPAGPLWHLPAYSIPGTPIGLSPIRYAAGVIGLGLAANRFGSQWFADGAHPTSVLTTDHEVTQAQAETLKQRVLAVTANNREPLVLGAGMKLDAMQVAPEDSQFLETLKANADDVARFFFRRPPGEGGQVTYANVEARSLDLLTYTLSGWLVRIERALTRLRPRPRFVKFNADALVRVDLAARYKAHDSAIRAGWKNRDEVRKLEDLPPIDDGTGGAFLWPPYSTSLVADEGGGSAQGPTQPA